MKIQKINKNLLDTYYKNKILYYQKLNNICYVTDSYIAYKLPANEFMLNPEKLKTCSINYLFDDYDYVDGIETKTYEEIKANNKKILSVIIKNEEKNLEVIVNKKYLELFEDYTLKIKSELSPVLVYEKGIIVGLIMPLKRY